MALARAAAIGRLAGAALLCWLTPASVWAEPLDLSDPTPRTIRVEFEISDDPRTIGQVYSAPVDATYSATGNTGTVVISSADYATAIQTHELDYFDAMMIWSLVAGSASAFTLQIDLTTLEGTALPASYEIAIQSPVQQLGAVDRELSTTATVGFTYLLPQYPGFPFFCLSSQYCQFYLEVAGAPYDPITGKINAVGTDHLDAPDIDLRSISRAGDLRLSESPAATVPALSSSGLCALALTLVSFAFLMMRRSEAAAQRGASINLW